MTKLAWIAPQWWFGKWGALLLQKENRTFGIKTGNEAVFTAFTIDDAAFTIDDASLCSPDPFPPSPPEE